MSTQTRLPGSSGHRRTGARPRVALLLAGLLVCVGIGGGQAAAQSQREGVSERQGIIELATRHHARTDTYYQLLRDWKTKQGVTWTEARQRAAAQTYKGRTGRLAILRDPDVFAWVLNSLPLASAGWGQGEAWIGLRYWCSARQLVWVDFRAHARNAPAPWAVPWNRGGNDVCARTSGDYMGVYHLGELGRWQAVAPPKRFPHYIVEFPPARSAVSSSPSDPEPTVR